MQRRKTPPIPYKIPLLYVYKTTTLMRIQWSYSSTNRLHNQFHQCDIRSSRNSWLGLLEVVQIKYLGFLKISTGASLLSIIFSFFLIILTKVFLRYFSIFFRLLPLFSSFLSNSFLGAFLYLFDTSLYNYLSSILSYYGSHRALFYILYAMPNILCTNHSPDIIM